MSLHHLERISDYHEYLREHPQEIDALIKDMLICVTDFFREPERISIRNPVFVWVNEGAISC
jgi:chemotaxis methyl-accepting protein methylase